MAVSSLFTNALPNRYCPRTHERYGKPLWRVQHITVQRGIIVQEGGQQLLNDLNLAGNSLLHCALNMEV